MAVSMGVAGTGDLFSAIGPGAVSVSPSGSTVNTSTPAPTLTPSGTVNTSSLALPSGVSGGGGASLPAAQDATLQSTVSSILGLQSTAVTDAANATAANTSAQGYAAEGTAYQTAADIASENATVAGIGGTVTQLQQQRATNVTIGAQKAGVAAAGFGASGSSLDLLRSSLQQGYVTQQLTGIQTSLTKGGYQQEAAASNAEEVAAQGTGAAATATAAADTTAANMARATAASETAALNGFLSSYTLTADQSLLLSPLAAADSIAAGGTGAPAGPTLTPSGLSGNTGGLSLGGTSVPTYAGPSTRNAVGTPTSAVGSAFGNL